MRSFILETLAAVGALVLTAAVAPAAALDSEVRLKQAAQHFVDLEDDQAKAILEELAEFDVTDAKMLLGYLYADPLYAGRDYEKAIVTFEEAAESGSEEALFQVAESRFWPDYSEWMLTPEEAAVRPTAEESIELLIPLVRESQSGLTGHQAAKWRLAHLCTFGGYDCGQELTDLAIEKGRWIGYDNLRVIAGAFHILKTLRSGEAEKAGTMKVFDPYLSLGYAVADPYVADAATAFVWREVVSAEECPSVDGFIARGRFLATENGVAESYEGRLDLKECYNAEELEALKEDVLATLDYLARGFGNDRGSWHLRRCFLEREAPSFGDCLLNAVRHHFFSCTKLSMPKYFSRFDIEYRTSKRYEQCREMMLGFPTVYNRI